MSDLLFPTLLGLGWDIVRTPTWRSGVQTALSGKTSSIAYQANPIIHWELNFELLRDITTPSELRDIVGLFNAVQGRFDSWLYNDPDFNSVTAQQFATGNSGAGPFQLYAVYENSGGPGYQEIVQNLNGAPSIYNNGTLVSSSDYTIGAAGQVTFNSGSYPATGNPLTWTGSFYYRCRFDEDNLQLSKFMNRLWEIKKIPFTQVLL